MYTYVTGYEKRDHFAHFLNFHLYLWNHSSYELQTWHEYSYVIPLQIVSPAHIRCGRGEQAHQLHSKIAVLYLTLAAHRSGQEACCSF